MRMRRCLFWDCKMNRHCALETKHFVCLFIYFKCRCLLSPQRESLGPPKRLLISICYHISAHLTLNDHFKVNCLRNNSYFGSIKDLGIRKNLKLLKFNTKRDVKQKEKCNFTFWSWRKYDRNQRHLYKKNMLATKWAIILLIGVWRMEMSRHLKNNATEN